MTSPADVEAVLERHHATLQGLGVRSLQLFGSVARGTGRAKSDLDVLYEFEPGAATLDRFIGLEETLRRLLGRDVDLVSRTHAGPILERYIRADAVTVYDADRQG